MVGLRAKFKNTNQLEADTKKFREKMLGKHIGELPDKIIFSLSADGQLGEGVIDLILSVTEHGKNKFTYNETNDMPSYMSFDASKESILDKAIFDLAELKNDLSKAKNVFDDRRFRICAYITSALNDDEKSVYHKFCIFNNLRFKIEMVTGTKKELIYSLDLSEYYALNSNKDVCDFELCSDGTYRITYL
ncbi:MAG: hypothetical protein J6A59_15900 [Lachnospiraceae bacterium]|nr:hypothetical protein [Lachnospiraceae bacterium]